MISAVSEESRLETNRSNFLSKLTLRCCLNKYPSILESIIKFELRYAIMGSNDFIYIFFMLRAPTTSLIAWFRSCSLGDSRKTSTIWEALTTMYPSGPPELPNISKKSPVFTSCSRKYSWECGRESKYLFRKFAGAQFTRCKFNFSTTHGINCLQKRLLGDSYSPSMVLAWRERDI